MNKTAVCRWTYNSRNGRSTYETLLWSDRSTSCNCPGWTRRVQSDGSRTCAHVRSVLAGDADDTCISKSIMTDDRTLYDGFGSRNVKNLKRGSPVTALNPAESMKRKFSV